MVLTVRRAPLGGQTAEEIGAERPPGTAESAPHEFSFARTALRVTIVSAILFAVYYANYVNGWITVDDLDWVSRS